jgi:translation initiation factor 2 beta subunit (eIF-2beta)/eIF-5
MKESKIDIIENFVKDLDITVKELNHYCKFLKFTKEGEKNIEEGFEILKQKIKKMKKSTSVDEIKKYIKVNKLLEKKD